MQNQNQQYFRNTTQMPAHINHGGHELLLVDGAISTVIKTLEQYTLFEGQIKDQELLTILQRQKSYMTGMYNILVDIYKTGQEPQVKTQPYMMNQSTEVVYGVQPSAPTKPFQMASEVTDSNLSTYMLSCLKTGATTFTTAALETCNPVLRRALQDSVPNLIELGYELFLYQNKHKYYQVPQLRHEDMDMMTQKFAPIQQNMTH